MSTTASLKPTQEAFALLILSFSIMANVATPAVGAAKEKKQKYDREEVIAKIDAAIPKAAGQDQTVMLLQAMRKCAERDDTIFSVRNKTELTTLPPEIGLLTKLEYLSLLDTPHLTTLPPEIGKLTNLTQLSITNSRLTKLPTEIGLLTKLTSLRIENSPLSALPPEIGKLTKLTNVFLGNNELAGLPPEFEKLTEIRRLILHKNPLTDTSLKHLKPLKNAHFILVDHTQVSIVGVTFLRQDLPNCRVHW